MAKPKLCDIRASFFPYLFQNIYIENKCFLILTGVQDRSLDLDVSGIVI